jgi:hypothetical protein
MGYTRGLLLVLTALSASLAGCAHTMTIAPEIEKLAPSADADRIPKNVGLYLSSEQRGKEVTTPGGGGDKVSYRPYADMETGIYKMLGNVYQNVTLLHSPDDSGAIAKNSLVYIVEPEVTTESSSSGVLTWMATDFTVGLTCKINDASGHSIAVITASGSGHADFSELKRNFSLAGQRASLDALLKEQALLLQSSALRQ